VVIPVIGNVKVNTHIPTKALSIKSFETWLKNPENNWVIPALNQLFILKKVYV